MLPESPLYGMHPTLRHLDMQKYSEAWDLPYLTFPGKTLRRQVCVRGMQKQELPNLVLGF